MSRRTGKTARRPGPGPGMTLTELVVSMAILSMMILMVSMLLVGARRTVRSAQEAIRADAHARAVAGRIREDLLGATKEGFLAITCDDNGLPHLIFTDVSTYRSVSAQFALSGKDVSGNFARIDYGLTSGPEKVLWRRAYLHVDDPVVAATARDDCVEGSLAGYRLLGADLTSLYPRSARAAIYKTLTDPNPTLLDAPQMTLPPPSVLESWFLWPYMIADVAELKIQWTDGARDPFDRLMWYDKDHPKQLGWEARGAHDPGPEFNFDDDGTPPPLYGALWTWQDKHNWPKAIRFQIKIGASERYYEVVVGLAD